MTKLWTAVIIVLVILGGVWWMNTRNLTPTSSNLTGASASPTVSANAVKASGTKKTSSPTPAMSYTQMVAQYGSNRIQFGEDCQTVPESAVFKNGTTIMLDNRSNQTRTIRLNSKSYTLSPYGYQIVTLTDSSLPETIKVSCNTRVNAGTILLQANISGE
ncbi:MAG: hypothetical protein UY36_C0009G0010 [Parcubacteria group bacterium GW2011_GWA1_49_11]|uniref:Uncharacterized protein n=1 Tax=Candidatus Yanofskybacteria bacterium RIFCSPHIGHO2_01_FULL_48_25b TaxID=1802672 RepID=A0A1F8F231_9BACT|nr:MAG: hypothetical protein UY36_C0009G0010 [Parcubacteria group bacterium GW2011_GWA1_49_11]OGN07194.1 MAG: hypothetical protein A2669_00445 [Candidatus Yanofskybacteria bacterium RIFCSPHIGHO2_01_FULL_48_25b]